ncbi:acetyl/propionyl/methylcrotonyl-CoA carboxylase subunit alpha [Seohaeicola saemankumensis]|uniref:acetyl-CoA carboxylase biotin carboxylase subunit n=1 Tax=Seohaeicola TaxID=481178 RepID=UPI0035D0FAEA
MPQLNKILIANRGEIAVRVIRTARAMGFRTVAVYSHADIDALHVCEADEAVCIGDAPAGESYLAKEKLIEACRLSNADAVHPGYGFLSENSDFARACDAAGITFIGPPSEAIELMGSKRLSKIAMIEAGVPCIPGYEGSDQSDDRLVQEAERIGYPLMVKASAGGGGRGMRLVWTSRDLIASIHTARSEARSAFGSDELILERALIEPRHVEIQVFADAHGNVVHFGERDCSIQRRHQKVVEEAPSPFVTPEMRQAMGEAAVNAARACNYCGAGTVEFLVDDDRNFFFLEMNTRLQVEHPVTELVTGQDLVAWQLRVAAGEPLPLTQDKISFDGWAMEVRLYAEDPQNEFLPQTGQVLVWDMPAGPGIRIDHGIRAGQSVSSHYDPMLAKIITHGATREEARRKLARAVEDTVLLGVNSNKAFLAKILRHKVFAEGGATTAFLQQHFEGDETMTADAPSLRVLSLAAVLMYARTGGQSAHTPDFPGWRNASSAPWRFSLQCGGKTYAVDLTVHRHGTCLRCTARQGVTEEVIELLGIDTDHFTYVVDGVRRRTRFVFHGDTLFLDGPFGNISFRDATHLPAARDETGGSGRVTAPMDGSIIAVNVALGDRVSKGQTVAVLEAMKMEHQLRADVSGVVAGISVSSGAQVKIRQLLMTIASSEDQVE